MQGMGFNDSDLDRFLVLLAERPLSTAVVRSLIFQFRKLKVENRKLIESLRECKTIKEDTPEATCRRYWETIDKVLIEGE